MFSKCDLSEVKALESGKVIQRIQLFRERLSNKTVRDNTKRYYG